jgi:hypothetical protein
MRCYGLDLSAPGCGPVKSYCDHGVVERLAASQQVHSFMELVNLFCYVKCVRKEDTLLSGSRELRHSPRRGRVTRGSQTSTLVEEEAPLQTTSKCGKKNIWLWDMTECETKIDRAGEDQHQFTRLTDRPTCLILRKIFWNDSNLRAKYWFYLHL